jgi:hypothetical protein
MPEPLPQVLRYECGHYADAETGKPLGYNLVTSAWVHSILAPCQKCRRPDRGPRLEPRPYDEQP